ncbi:MAG: serine/threonine protein kinase [Chloroflexota bacterium]
MSNLTGQSLGRYHILEQLGEGGMAIVYKAYDTRLERDVAVKVIRTEKLTIETMGKTLKRFEREAKALAKLTHPNIVSITDYGERDEKPYLVMPYLPGGTLKQKLGKPIPWEESVRLLIPISRALHYAHQQGIIHRDVKPSNILITQSGEPMLTDFGIAKILLDNEETADLTGTGMGVGTPEYMSPEQFQGKGVDARTDVYSIGVVLYEMVTGRKPYQADTPAAVLIKQVTEPLPRPKSFVPDLSDEFEKILLKALAKNKEDRFEDMASVALAFEKKAHYEIPHPTIQDAITPTPRESDENKTILQAITNATTDALQTVLQESQPSFDRKVAPTPPTKRRSKSKSCLVYVIVEDGTPLYKSLPSSTNWDVWLNKGDQLSVVDSDDYEISRIGKYGHYIFVSDKKDNKGYIMATAISTTDPK